MSYHRSTWHNTNDCRDLKEEVESLIRRGHLREILAKLGEPYQPYLEQHRQQGLVWGAQPVVPDCNPLSRAKNRMIIDRNQYIKSLEGKDIDMPMMLAYGKTMRWDI